VPVPDKNQFCIDIANTDQSMGNVYCVFTPPKVESKRSLTIFRGLVKKKVAILHEPTQHDSSHSGIHGYQPEDLLVTELIAEIVMEIFPSKQT